MPETYEDTHTVPDHKFFRHVEDTERHEVSCFNCRSYRVGLGSRKDEGQVVEVRCHRDHYLSRRIDRHIPHDMAKTARERAFRCPDFDLSA